MHQDLYQKDMESTACVYEERTAAIHELTQGIQMTQQLRLNLHSREAREHLIKKILSSYENALSVLRSGASAGQPWTSALPAPGLPESSMFIMSPGIKEFEFDQLFTIQQEQNVIGKKRKVSTTWEDQVGLCNDNGLEGNTFDSYNWMKHGQKDVSGAKIPGSYNSCSYPKVQKCMTTKQVQMIDEDCRVFDIPNIAKLTCDGGAQSTVPPPPPSPEKHEIAPTQHHHQLPPLKHGEMLSNLRANLSVNTSDLGGETVTSSFSSPSTSSVLGEDFHRFQYPNQYYDELLLVYSPPLISSQWGSSSSMDFAATW